MAMALFCCSSSTPDQHASDELDIVLHGEWRPHHHLTGPAPEKPPTPRSSREFRALRESRRRAVLQLAWDREIEELQHKLSRPPSPSLPPVRAGAPVSLSDLDTVRHGRQIKGSKYLVNCSDVRILVDGF